jgi:outer membrane protein OmpA-like peptidoglycan-associated protein
MTFIIALLIVFAAIFGMQQDKWGVWQDKLASWWSDFTVPQPVSQASDAGPQMAHNTTEIPSAVQPGLDSELFDQAPAVEVVVDAGPGAIWQTDPPTVEPADTEIMPGPEQSMPITEAGERIAPPEVSASPAKDQILLVEFGFDSADLSLQSRDILDQAVESLNSAGSNSAIITGYSDNRGDETYNLSLSYKRAEAAAQYVISRGIARDRLQIEGRGVSQDAAGANIPGSARDYSERRVVEIRIRVVGLQ